MSTGLTILTLAFLNNTKFGHRCLGVVNQRTSTTLEDFAAKVHGQAGHCAFHWTMTKGRVTLYTIFFGGSVRFFNREVEGGVTTKTSGLRHTRVSALGVSYFGCFFGRVKRTRGVVGIVFLSYL